MEFTEYMDSQCHGPQEQCRATQALWGVCASLLTHLSGGQYLSASRQLQVQSVKAVGCRARAVEPCTALRRPPYR